MNVFVLFVIEKCVGSCILVEANLFLAIKLQPDLIIRAILQVASILRSKLKIEIERKFYCNATPMNSRLFTNQAEATLQMPYPE